MATLFSGSATAPNKADKKRIVGRSHLGSVDDPLFLLAER